MCNDHIMRELASFQFPLQCVPGRERGGRVYLVVWSGPTGTPPRERFRKERVGVPGDAARPADS